MSSMIRYEAILPITWEQAAAELATGDASRTVNTLLSLAYHCPNWRCVQDLCVQYSRHQDVDVRGVAVLCFGHLARIHGVLDTGVVLPLLKELANDPEIGGWVQDALDDIRMFLHRGEHEPCT